MFNQCKSITKATSNQNANQLITNILIRTQEEEKARSTLNDSFHRQESEVQKLAQALPPKENTIIPNSWISESPRQYQTHLERISDYLVKGPGLWWRSVENGIEFFDCTHDTEFPEHQMRHFRSSTLSDIDVYLQTKWEECVTNISLPASHIRHYNHNGDLRGIHPVTCNASDCHSPTELSTAEPETYPQPCSSEVAATPPHSALETAGNTLSASDTAANSPTVIADNPPHLHPSAMDTTANPLCCTPSNPPHYASELTSNCLPVNPCTGLSALLTSADPQQSTSEQPTRLSPCQSVSEAVAHPRPSTRQSEVPAIPPQSQLLTHLQCKGYVHDHLSSKFV